ncbi:hypothetical protein M2171_004373 [Bradyrhizobium japonicum USDA 38]|nr:hypothetical protein [Bradyrhizobium japonicum USDA 38]MCS3947755.1 hypothetical protein [Bradyrhizobium japonicum]MCW2219414.1 hypothetical protein [Bradyrhizobium japonicum]MCW2344028.1 hypothetical protein [Bradyrhizobium japonicum]
MVYVSAGLGLPSPTDGGVAYRPMGKQFGFLAKSSGFFGEAILK